MAIATSQQMKQIVKTISKDIAVFKRNFLGAPIERALRILADSTPLPDSSLEGTVPDTLGCQIKYRPNEAYWVIPNKTSVIVIFAVDFKDPVDQGLARVLLLVRTSLIVAGVARDQAAHEEHEKSSRQQVLRPLGTRRTGEVRRGPEALFQRLLGVQ